MMMYNPDTNEIAKPSELLNGVRAYMNVLQSIENYGECRVKQTLNVFLSIYNCAWHESKTAHENILQRIWKLFWAYCIFLRIEYDECWVKQPITMSFKTVTAYRNVFQSSENYGEYRLKQPIWISITALKIIMSL